MLTKIWSGKLLSNAANGNVNPPWRRHQISSKTKIRSTILFSQSTPGYMSKRSEIIISKKCIPCSY